MITKSTTFVLGAGASCEYGLPLGSGLISAMVGQISAADGRHKNSAQWIDVPEDILQSFSKKLIDSDIRSIDAWLSRQTIASRFPEIGRMAIARAIHEHESSQDPRQGWYSVLWNKMAEGCGTLKEFVDRNRVNFVTFNYDRSLEYYFEKTTRATFPDAAENLRLLEQIGIIHMHGRVGRLGWHSPLDDVEVMAPYGGLKGTTESNWKLAKQCTAYFRIIGQEDSVSMRAVDAARHVMHRSDRISLLGFGFHSDNVEKIRMDRTKTKATVEVAIHKASNKMDMKSYAVSSETPFGKEMFLREIENLKDYVDQLMQKMS